MHSGSWSPIVAFKEYDDNLEEKVSRLEAIYHGAIHTKMYRNTAMIACVPNAHPYPTLSLNGGFQKGTVNEIVCRVNDMNCATTKDFDR